jgi:Ca2+-binding RTX toxin-like protein
VQIDMGALTTGGAAAGDRFTGFQDLEGSAFADDLIGSGGANRITAGDGADRLSGGGGNDHLAGGFGDDRLSGGTGADVLCGDWGNDAFVFAAPGDGADRLADWGAMTGNDDRILLQASGFGMATGALSTSAFRTGTAAGDATDRVIFRTTDATLWFDRDGIGQTAAVLIATLPAYARLTAADILLI